MAELTCEELADLCAELALGVAPARERAAAVAHLDHCPACRRELRSLSEVAEGLAALAPAGEPLPGFESRVLARLAAPAPKVARRGGRVVRLAVAAAAAAAVAAGGWAVGASTSSLAPAGRRGVVAATLRSHRRAVGRVVVSAGSAPWISMAVDTGGGDETVRCELRRPGGGTVTIGTFRLSGGYGYWAAPVPAGGGYSAALLVDAAGRVVAQAALPAWR